MEKHWTRFNLIFYLLLILKRNVDQLVNDFGNVGDVRRTSDFVIGDKNFWKLKIKINGIEKTLELLLNLKKDTIELFVAY